MYINPPLGTRLVARVCTLLSWAGLGGGEERRRDVWHRPNQKQALQYAKQKN